MSEKENLLAMTSSDDEPITMDTMLPYEGSAAEFRLYVGKQAGAAQNRYSDLINRNLAPAERAAHWDAMHASGFGWALVAVLGWLRDEHGEEMAWNAAAVAQDVMVNGGNSFCEDIPYESGALVLEEKNGA